MNEKELTEYKKIAKDMLVFMKPYCCSIYLGGSLVYPQIRNSHDVDFIIFSTGTLENKCHTKRLSHVYKKKNKLPENIDVLQQRTSLEEEHSYGSFINKKMIKLAGDDIDFDFDVIGKDRDEYKSILLETAEKIQTGKITNKKRWYQVLCGYYILKNNSYDLTETQLEEINIVHDQADGWEKYVENLKQKIEKL